MNNLFDVEFRPMDAITPYKDGRPVVLLYKLKSRRDPFFVIARWDILTYVKYDDDPTPIERDRTWMVEHFNSGVLTKRPAPQNPDGWLPFPGGDCWSKPMSVACISEAARQSALNRFHVHPEALDGFISAALLDLILRVHPDQGYTSEEAASLVTRAYQLGRSEALTGESSFQKKQERNDTERVDLLSEPGVNIVHTIKGIQIVRVAEDGSQSVIGEGRNLRDALDAVTIRPVAEWFSNSSKGSNQDHDEP